MREMYRTDSSCLLPAVEQPALELLHLLTTVTTRATQ